MKDNRRSPSIAYLSLPYLENRGLRLTTNVVSSITMKDNCRSPKILKSPWKVKPIIRRTPKSGQTTIFRNGQPIDFIKTTMKDNRRSPTILYMKDNRR
jgi:hypothetical protein